MSSAGTISTEDTSRISPSPKAQTISGVLKDPNRHGPIDLTYDENSHLRQRVKVEENDGLKEGELQKLIQANKQLEIVALKFMNRGDLGHVISGEKDFDSILASHPTTEKDGAGKHRKESDFGRTQRIHQQLRGRLPRLRDRYFYDYQTDFHCVRNPSARSMLYVTVSLTISMEASADRRRCIDYGQQSVNHGYVADILSRRHDRIPRDSVSWMLLAR